MSIGMGFLSQVAQQNANKPPGAHGWGWNTSTIVHPSMRHAINTSLGRGRTPAPMYAAGAQQSAWLQQILANAAKYKGTTYPGQPAVTPAPLPGPTVTPTGWKPGMVGNPFPQPPALVTQAGTGPARNARVTQPGINPLIATQLPQNPSDGIPKIAGPRGWVSQGAGVNQYTY